MASTSLNIDIPSKTPECEYSLGDANMDHVVDEKDSVYISNIVLGNVEVKDMTLTDVTGDGIIDTLDVINVNYLII